MYTKIEQWVEENAGQPFMLMWTTTVPHSTVQAPEDEVMYYVDKLGEEKTPVTDGGWYYPVLYPHSAYAAMVTHIDTQVGGGPFKCRKGWGKSSLHEGGIRMPFVLAWGDRLKGTGVQEMPFPLPAGGRIERHVGQFTDLMPTFAELAGVEAPENDGVSFAPILLGKKQKEEHESLYWEFPGGKGWFAVRNGPWKGLIQKAKTEDAKMELFNLDEDPRESNDVAGEHPEIVAKLWQIMQDSHTVPEGLLPQFTINLPAHP